MAKHICNFCYDGGNRGCVYAKGIRSCSVLSMITADAFNIKCGHDRITDLDIQVSVDDDQWCAVTPTGEGTFIILSWYKDKSYLERAFILDELNMRPLTNIDVNAYVILNENRRTE